MNELFVLWNPSSMRILTPSYLLIESVWKMPKAVMELLPFPRNGIISNFLLAVVVCCYGSGCDSTFVGGHCYQGILRDKCSNEPHNYFTDCAEDKTPHQ